MGIERIDEVSCKKCLAHKYVNNLKEAKLWHKEHIIKGCDKVLSKKEVDLLYSSDVFFAGKVKT